MMMQERYDMIDWYVMTGDLLNVNSFGISMINTIGAYVTSINNSHTLKVCGPFY